MRGGGKTHGEKISLNRTAPSLSISSVLFFFSLRTCGYYFHRKLNGSLVEVSILRMRKPQVVIMWNWNPRESVCNWPKPQGVSLHFGRNLLILYRLLFTIMLTFSPLWCKLVNPPIHIIHLMIRRIPRMLLDFRNIIVFICGVSHTLNLPCYFGARSWISAKGNAGVSTPAGFCLGRFIIWCSDCWVYFF